MDDIILYDDRDIKYEIINYESEYIIYAKLYSSTCFKILGFIKFKFISEYECVVEELIVNPTFKSKLYQEIKDFDDIINFSCVNISKILLKKSEKIGYNNGIKYMIIDGKYKKISKPLSLLYFYIFLIIIIGLKILKFLF